MKNVSLVKQALQMAAPIMVGYIFLGIPCGILSQSVGMDALQVFLLSALFYSGAGQYMIPNMWLLGSPMAAIIASVTLVNSRQMLYSASLSRFCENVNKRLAFLYGATVTDESFAVNVVKLEQGEWNIKGATLVNLFSQSSWALAWKLAHRAHCARIVRHDEHLLVLAVLTTSHQRQHCCWRGCGAWRVPGEMRGAFRASYLDRCSFGRCCWHDRGKKRAGECTWVGLSSRSSA